MLLGIMLRRKGHFRLLRILVLSSTLLLAGGLLLMFAT